MAVYQHTIEVATDGRSTVDISNQVQAIVSRSDIESGICQVFVQHTSASLMLTENADPEVRRDLEVFMSRAVPDGDSIYRHTMEGPDDMSAHVRSVLTQSGLSVPVGDGRCLLGTWQGIYLWEHRTTGHNRCMVVTVIGE
ncbi:MAG TPA: secondary thiamine-phosphate synthase enzyme YjbQ [Gammaproteobacteria bacterium]|jgi:secondary thiamine-phosphate synthase enzyme|nr:secondary thiamine-phosphate synthase [Chromatiales bacterium]MCP4925871.1 YjbQ family protein [Gammaproteobacteria bacterium]MDP7153349.1 secondary thiamine-phosphate synthase enzyme YjbQ [Gammaproteobacteria bacterium]MDP7296661.1 secondary thiamine-phosphate synthase enzyme YjbQ [Gammaproteobacteria bacterium]MDP7660262.1 secondary thiamine-phosphate synthase enzyme YjbQ [Gammaproteobacteria bacterium]